MASKPEPAAACGYPDTPLGPQLRPLEDTQSAFTVLRNAALAAGARLGV